MGQLKILIQAPILQYISSWFFVGFSIEKIVPSISVWNGAYFILYHLGNGRITTYYHIVRKRKRTQKEGCKARTGKFRATHKSHPKIADSAEKMRKVAKNIPNVSGESHNATKAFLKSHSYYFLGHCKFISKRCNKSFAKNSVQI